MISFHGTDLSLVRDVVSTDITSGPVRTLEWHGRKSSVELLYASIGEFRKSVDIFSGPVYRLIVTITGAEAGGQPPGSEDPVDQWTITTDLLEKEIWRHPKLVAAATAFDSTYPQKFRKQLENHAEEEEPSSSPAVLGDTTSLAAPYDALLVWQVAQGALLELSRGGTHFEDEYIVLRRNRTISPSYPTAMPLYSTRPIYATAQLPLPGVVLFSLPSFPANPPQSQWGYRLRAQESQFQGPDKIVQTFEWVLAAWSTLTYELATSNFPP